MGFHMSPEENIAFMYIVSTVLIILLVAFVLIYVAIHQRRLNIARKHELFAALSEGEEKERKRLSEELHDGIAAKLVGLKMNMEYLALSQEEKQREHISKLTLNMDELVNELRELSLNLQPSFIHTKGLKATLQEITDNLNGKSNCRYRLFTDFEEEGIPQPLILQVCRIASELLVNIHKHAQASEAAVQVMLNEDVLQIIAEDNGVGMKEGTEKKGVGLVNLQNRVAYLKGQMNIDSSDKGTTVIIELKTTI
jgi:two-component system, NarL family, sensor kinase